MVLVGRAQASVACVLESVGELVARFFGGEGTVVGGAQPLWGEGVGRSPFKLLLWWRGGPQALVLVFKYGGRGAALLLLVIVGDGAQPFLPDGFSDGW